MKDDIQAPIRQFYCYANLLINTVEICIQKTFHASNILCNVLERYSATVQHLYLAIDIFIQIDSATVSNETASSTY